MPLHEDLVRLAGELRRRLEALGSPEQRRRKLGQVGILRALRPRAPSGQLWGAADGSRISVGGPYPYTVELFRALARDTGGAQVLLEQARCPLLEQPGAGRAGGPGGEPPPPREGTPGTPPGGAPAGEWEEERAEGERRRVLAAMECLAAAQLVRSRRPSVMVLDGSLLVFSSHAGAAWDELQEAADQAGTVVCGVVEDIATRGLAERVGIPFPAYDREVLHGVLQPGEALILEPEAGLKKGFATAFVRWGAMPRPTAVDVRTRDAERLPELLDELAALVPGHGRGMPALMDLVDRDVRLREEEAMRWLEAGWGSGLYRTWLLPLRQQREL